eukprot:5374707-Prymnesium_polylepis.1
MGQTKSKADAATQAERKQEALVRLTTKLLVIGAPGTSTSCWCESWLAAAYAHIGADVEGDPSADNAAALTKYTYVQRAPRERIQLLEPLGSRAHGDTRALGGTALFHGVVYIASQEAVATGLDAMLADFERVSAACEETIVFVIFDQAEMPTPGEAGAFQLVRKQLLERIPSHLKEQPHWASDLPSRFIPCEASDTCLRPGTTKAWRVRSK